MQVHHHIRLQVKLLLLGSDLTLSEILKKPEYDSKYTKTLKCFKFDRSDKDQLSHNFVAGLQILD